jgi:hypothetical protein
MQKNPPSVVKNAAKRGQEPLFITWHDEATKKVAFASAASAMSNTEPIFHSKSSTIFRDLEPNLSVRDSITRRDYENFRPDEVVPDKPKKLIAACMAAYDDNGIIKNVIDTMSEFTCQGIEIVHPNKKIQEFHRQWARKINFVERSERFVNLLLRTANVPMKRTHAKLRAKDVDNMQRGYAGADVEPDVVKKVEKNEIPYSYTFLSPLSIEPIGGEELSVFAGKTYYGLRIPRTLAAKIKNAKKPEEKLLLQQIPDDIIAAIKRGETLIPLNPEKVSMFHYKKDDWQMWARPMIASILKNIIMLDKLMLADLCALDGAISHIRLWRLGSLAEHILPTPAGVAKLADMLANSVGGGAMDLIWGPELDFKETSTDIYKFLGSEKYGPTLSAIYAGLGIPPTLTGSATQGGFTNNFISLQTLIERLMYIRTILVRMWETELIMIQRAFNFRVPAQLRFSRMTLNDATSEKALLIQLADRGLISIETIQERFGEIPELELLRMSRERRERKRGTRDRKAGPWNNPEHTEKLQTIALQTGGATPSEVGLELEERKPGEKSALEMKVDSKPQNTVNQKLKGKSGQGRPPGKKDSTKRKRKIVKASAVANITTAFSWARATQESIAKIVNPWYLQMIDKKNMRSLSDEESRNVELLKYAVLCNTEAFSDVTEHSVANLLQNEIHIPDCIQELCDKTVVAFTNKFNREPNMEEVRQINASVYALSIGGAEDGEN